MSKKKHIDAKNIRLLEEIKKFLSEKGYSPSLAELCILAEISSPSIVNYRLDQLEDAGHIERDQRIYRGIEVLNGN